MHQRPAAAGEPTLHHQCVPCGEEHLGDCRSVTKANRGWHRHELTLVHCNALGVGAARIDSHHFVAALP